VAKSRTRTGVPSQRIASSRSPITSVALSIIRSTAKLGGAGGPVRDRPAKGFRTAGCSAAI